MDNTLILRFSGILQSWGVPEPWESQRKTEYLPTDDAIYGLLGCALGILRDDASALSVLREKVRVISSWSAKDTIDNRLYDYQTVGLMGGKGHLVAKGGVKNINGIVETIQEEKEYLEDAERFVKLECIDEETKTRLIDAILHPVYPYYLGRYCCTPSKCLLMKEE